jgi:hypothetical protein
MVMDQIFTGGSSTSSCHVSRGTTSAETTISALIVDQISATKILPIIPSDLPSSHSSDLLSSDL